MEIPIILTIEFLLPLLITRNPKGIKAIHKPIEAIIEKVVVPFNTPSGIDAISKRQIEEIILSVFEVKTA